MSHITEFSIWGLAGRKEVYSQKLDRHLNVFFGLNGSGKTSLLKILDSAMERKTDNLINVPFEKAQVKIYSINFKKEFLYKITKKNQSAPSGEKDEEEIQGDSDETEDFEFNSEYLNSRFIQKAIEKKKNIGEWEITPDLQSGSGLWKHGYLPTTRLYWGMNRFSVEERRISEEALDQNYANSLQSIWRNYNHDISQKIREAQEDGLANILKDVLIGSQSKKKTIKEVDLKTAYDRVAKFLERQGSKGVIGKLDKFEERYMNNLQLRNVVSDIDEIEKKIATATAPRRNLENLISKMFTGNKKIDFGDSDIRVITQDEQKISLASLSSGEKHVLRILIEVLKVDECSLIIDEPEISMHVDWQKDLISVMRQLNPNAQIIIATHSPEIMADVNEKYIHRL